MTKYTDVREFGQLVKRALKVAACTEIRPINDRAIAEPEGCFATGYRGMLDGRRVVARITYHKDGVREGIERYVLGSMVSIYDGKRILSRTTARGLVALESIAATVGH